MRTPHSFLYILTNAVTEWPCDWLHLFGGHGFDLLASGRTKCAWVPWELHNSWEEAITKTPAS